MAGHRRLLAIYAPAVVLLGAISALHLAGLGNANVLLRDTAAIAGAPFYWGAISTLGGLLWAAAATSCALGALVLFHTTGWTSQVRFLSGGAVVNAALGVDDLLMIHDGAAPALGLHEYVVFALIGLPMLLWAVAYRQYFRVPGETSLLVSALVLLGLSLSVDVLDLLSSYWLFLEDVLKYLGLVGWALYWFRSVAATLTVASDRSFPRPKATMEHTDEARQAVCSPPA